MKPTLIIVLILLFAGLIIAKAQNAPISNIGEIENYNSTVIVPVTISGFINVGSCNLKVLYDPLIANCTSVTLGTGVAGGISSNLSFPGVITIGWYTWPGITLPDNTVIFGLNFSTVGYGFTEVTWDFDYPDRQWFSGNFVQLTDIPVQDFYLNGSLFFKSENAPITFAPDLIAIPGDLIQIPIMVTGFNNIGSLKLLLEYDPTKLSFATFTNNSGFPGFTLDGSSPGIISASGLVGAGSSGIFLPDNDTLFSLFFSYLGGNADLTWVNAGSSCQYSGYPGYNELTDIPTENYYFNGSVKESLLLEITVFLEGPFENGEMSTHLKDNNLLPLSQPYSVAPWFYNGDESVTNIPTNTVDWVLIELRETTGDASTATPDNIISRKAGLIMKNGSVKSTDGTGNLSFQVAPTGNLFIVVYHRNHISIISADPVAVINGIGGYNFTSGTTQVFGYDAGHKELIPGIWGMTSGDSNADGIINMADKQNYLDLTVGTQGYLSSDFSLDGQVNNLDKNDFWLTNINFNSQVP